MDQEHRLPEDGEAPAASIGDDVGKYHAQVERIQQMTKEIEGLKIKEQQLMREFDAIAHLRRKLGVEIMESDNAVEQQKHVLLERLREVLMASGMTQEDAEKKARNIVAGAEEIPQILSSTRLEHSKTLPHIILPPEKKLLVATESSERIWKQHEEIRFSRLQRGLAEIEQADEIPGQLTYMGSDAHDPIARNRIGFRAAICRSILPDVSQKAIDVMYQLPGPTSWWDEKTFWETDRKAALTRLRALSVLARKDIVSYSGIDAQSLENTVSPQMRWMISRDYDEVAQNDRAAFAEKDVWDLWDKEDYILKHKQRNCIMMVAECNSKIVGHIVYELHKEYLLLIRMVVRPDFRHRGVGEFMIMQLNWKLACQKRKSVLIQLPISDVESMQFFASCGLIARPEFQKPLHHDEETLATMELVVKTLPLQKVQDKEEWFQIADEFLTQAA